MKKQQDSVETIKTCCETEADDSGLNIAIESFKIFNRGMKMSLKKHIRFLLRTKGFPEKVYKISQALTFFMKKHFLNVSVFIIICLLTVILGKISANHWCTKWREEEETP